MLTVAAFFRFAPLPDFASRAAPLRALAAGAGLSGTVLLAPEGVNGTLAGTAGGVEAVLDHLRGWPGCAGLTPRLSTAAAMPFARLKVRLKREIVALGAPDLDPLAPTGTRVRPADWDALLADPGVAVIDTRNGFEVAMGTFPGALDPGTARFRDFPAWWAANRGAFAAKRIAMFCTGGIRCEKASRWLLAQGVPEVLQLDGGILGYLAEVPPRASRWRGDCFVFDERQALGPGLVQAGPSHPVRPVASCRAAPTAGTLPCRSTRS